MELLVVMEKAPMTAPGYEKLTEEVKHLKSVERPSIIKAIAEAREHGDLSENAEYHAAKERQSFIEGRLLELQDLISRADIIDISKLTGEVVKFGATVTVVDVESDEESVFQIVGSEEADVKAGRLSFTSPVARALIGKTIGDEVEVVAPGGHRGYEVLKVAFA